MVWRKTEVFVIMTSLDASHDKNDLFINNLVWVQPYIKGYFCYKTTFTF